MDLSSLQNISDLVVFQPITIGVVFAAVLAALLLFVSGFASGSEIAFFSLSPTDLAEIDDEKTPTDQHVKELREDSERTLATILITNNFVNVTIIMLCNYVFASLVQFKAAWVEFLCITVLLTFLLLLFGEIMPKVYSRQDPLKFCRRSVGFILVMRRLFWPLETLLMHSGALAEKVVQHENHVLSVDDLEQALELTDKDEIREEQQMLKGIIRFGDETAKEVMTSRQDIVDLDIRSSFADVLQCIVENNYSRIPVYQGNTDNIRGVLYIKDLLRTSPSPLRSAGRRLFVRLTSYPRPRRLTTCCASSRRAKCTSPLSSTSSEAPAVWSPSRTFLRRLWAKSTMSSTRRRRLILS